ncbi:MAG: hypothetical protein NC043_08515 [Muribaculaceae bacterium]|nr:hypothetical protein [Muribaculaceae bacterium]
MKRNGILGILLLGLIILTGACHDNAWDELPEPIAQFITKYFPEGEVASYVTDGAGNHVATIKNGATLTFDKEYAWIDVNGNGSTLPPMFLFDRLPDALYRYIQEMELTDGVYRVTRSSTAERVDFLNTYVLYEFATGQISYPS